MSSPDNLLKATINRLAVRAGQKLTDIAAELAVLAQDAPEKFQEEWDQFQKEVFTEAERLERQSTQEKTSGNWTSDIDGPESSQQKIDELRAKVADLSTKYEAKT